jgi:hypothetical protein
MECASHACASSLKHGFSTPKIGAAFANKLLPQKARYNQQSS